MIKISQEVTRSEAGSVLLFCPIKNEMKFLPHFLKHYRRLGIKDFIFIDNCSTDGGVDYLMQQSDCTIFQTDRSFKDSNFGMDWVNVLIQDLCLGKWAIFVDCDEFLVFENCESEDLPEFCRKSKFNGFDTVAAAMIDMYPSGDFLNCHFTSSDELIEVMPYFDSEYLFRRWPRRIWDSSQSNFDLQVIGGPRIRLLSSLEVESKRGAYYYTICNQVDRFIEFVPEKYIKYVASMWPVEIPAQQKRPLNFITEKFSYHSNHASNNVLLSNDFVALLHFKLCDELRKRVSQTKLLASHYRRGLSYEQLRQAILKFEGSSLTYSGTLKYGSSRDLLQVGIIGKHVSQLWTGGGHQKILTPKTGNLR